MTFSRPVNKPVVFRYDFVNPFVRYLNSQLTDNQNSDLLTIIENLPAKIGTSEVARKVVPLKIK